MPGLSEHAARLVKIKARVAGAKLAAIAVAEIAEEVGFPFSVGKEFRVHFRRVEAGHGAAVKSQGSRGEMK